MANPEKKGYTQNEDGKFVSTKKIGRPSNKELIAKKIAKAKEQELTDEDEVELYLAESGSLMADVLKRIKKTAKRCKDAGELSRMMLNLLDIRDRLKGNRTASRARAIKKTAQEISESGNRAALIAAGVAKTPADLAQIVVDKTEQTPQT